MTDLTNDEHLAALTLYGLYDGVTQGRALPHLVQSARTHGNLRALKHDNSLQPVIRDMTELGVPQSRAIATEQKEKVETRLSELLARLREISGLSELNPKSPQQVAKYLYRTKHDGVFLEPQPVEDEDGNERAWEEGDPLSVGRPALLELEDRGVPPYIAEFIQCQIQYGSLKSLLSGPIERVFNSPPHPAAPETLTWLRPSFRKETTTGRLVSNPNIQNYASRGFVNVKNVMVPPPGHVFIVTDSEQLELRLYAAESQDQYYTKAFLEGLDAHSLNVVSLMPGGDSIEAKYGRFMANLRGEKGSDFKKEAKKIRTMYKCVVFSMLYGAGWEKVFEIMSKDIDKATGVRLFPGLKPSVIQQIYLSFKRFHPELTIWHERVDRHVQTRGFVEEEAGGRRMVYPEGVSEPNAPRNFTIQSAASYHMDIALQRIAEAFPFRSLSPWTGVFNLVHDEVALSIPESHVDEAIKVCEAAFTSEHKGIPLLGEPEIHLRYGTAEKIS